MSEANTIEAPGEFDALVKLRDGEPYFVLIGRDEFAPKLVCDWADANRRRALNEADVCKIDADRLQHELRQSTQAEMVASEMTAYRKGFKEVEPKAQTRPTYSGHVMPKETAARDRERTAQLRAASVMHNAIAELTEAVDALSILPPHFANARLAMRSAITSLEEAVAKVEPQRPGIKG